MTELISSNFIGCGKLGKTIAYLLVKNNLIQIPNIYCRTLKSCQNAIQFIGQGEICLDLNLLKPADIYFICTPDDVIEKICKQLIEVHKPNKNAIFVHFSGLLTSDILKSARDCGYHIGSLHPIKSFALPQENIKNFEGTFCAFEGAVYTFKLIENMFQKIGANIFTLQKEYKPLYHAAAVFSSNYLITLANIAKQCFEQAGVSGEIAKNIIVSLMQGTLNNLGKVNHISDALTGPLQRGDINSIEAHIDALNFNSNFKDAYGGLGKLTLEMTEHKPELKLVISKLLEKTEL